MPVPRGEARKSALAIGATVPTPLAMSIATTARSAYLSLCGSSANLAVVKAEAESLALSLLTNPDTAFELTSSTVNGQTFSGKRTMTNDERLKVLRLVIKQFEMGCALSTTAYARF